MDINRVMIVGRLTRDPEMRTSNTGIHVVNFSIAVNRVWRDKDGGKKDEVSYFDCVAFGRTAEVIKEYASKGKQVAIDGRLVQGRWTDANGQSKSKVEIYVENLQLLGSKSDGSGFKKESPVYDDEPLPPQSFPDDNDDIPF